MNELVMAARKMRQRLLPVAERPGMWGLHDNFDEVSAFLAGCDVASPGVFDELRQWGITRIRGARDKYAFAHALGVLAAERVATGVSSADRPQPLASAFLLLVCEYLAEFEDPEAPARIRAEYEKARAAYLLAHESAHTHGTDVWDPRWNEECWEWEQVFVPALVYAPEPSDPWRHAKTSG
jgi:hypothetical protein